MLKQLSSRQIHLDFHTSEHIAGVGADFDPRHFNACLERADVDWVNLFAKCHHGWSYYPTAVGTPHPHLSRPDLLGDMVSACRSSGIGVGIYVSVQWDEVAARNHPDWIAVTGSDCDEKSAETKEEFVGWKSLCLSNQEYLDYVVAQVREVLERYRPDGLWMDILTLLDCRCPNCTSRMRRAGRDPQTRLDRIINHRELLISYYRRIHDVVRSHSQEIRLFHNSGHLFKGERDRLPYFSHFEVESLPTGGWGYDHFPLSAKYASALGIDFLGMTGRFHTLWGEFGGYKTSTALEYECATMAAHGGGCSIGDQLHPSGGMDDDTYRLIAPAYRRIARMEDLVRGSRPLSEIALLSSEAHRWQVEGVPGEGSNTSDNGAARMLMELQEPFDVIDWEHALESYNLLILPDTVTLTDALADRLRRYLDCGGRIILTGASGMNAERSAFLLDLGADYRGQESGYSPDYIVASGGLDPGVVLSPFVVYERAFAVKAREAEVLCESRLPYFNRTAEHFCSHQHAPYRPERNEEYDAVIRYGAIAYFSHPLFRAYFNSGQPLLKYLFRGILNALLPIRRLSVTMPSSGRVTLNNKGNQLHLHLFAVQPELRGHDVLPQKGHLQIEVIEDSRPLYDISCSIASEREPKRVRTVFGRQTLPFAYNEGRLTFLVPEVAIHELVVIELENDGSEEALMG